MAPAYNPGPSRLSVAQRDMLRAGYLRAERDSWLRRARAALDSAGSTAMARKIAAGYVRQARYAQSAYLLQLSAPPVQS